MEAAKSRSTASSTSATSRRALREARTATDPTAAGSRPRRVSAPRWLPRAGVLAALAGATIAVPLVSASSSPEVPATDVAATALTAGYPTAYEVLSAGAPQTTPTSVLAAVKGAERVAETVSRSLERESLPGCDGSAKKASSNGLIPESDLCQLWEPGQMLRGDAAVALSELNDNFRAAFDRDICITDSYRTLAEQRRLAYTKPGLAASPGTSNHGWGLAIDLCTSENRSTAVMSWLSDNGPTFGWDNPDWARRGGSGAYEPWHWEYVPGTTEMGTNY